MTEEKDESKKNRNKDVIKGGGMMFIAVLPKLKE